MENRPGPPGLGVAGSCARECDIEERMKSGV